MICAICGCTKEEAIELCKYKKMWANLKSVYGYRTTYDTSGEQQLCKFINIMDKVETTFLGSKPKTRREKLTNIIQAVYNSYVYREQVHNKERDDIIKSLVKLRDEEEDI